MSTPSYSGIIQSGLIYHTDLAQSACWNLAQHTTITTDTTTGSTTGSTTTVIVTGIPVIKPLPTSNIVVGAYIALPDMGLNEVDLGRVIGSTSTGSTNQSLGLSLSEVGYPNITSGYTHLQPVTGDTTGNYTLFNGNYVQSFFKLDGYNYEVLPARYAFGVTLETSLLITDASFNNPKGNIFLFLGARSENKFYANDYTGTTVSGLPLGPDDINDMEAGIGGNLIAFLFDSSGRIGYRVINEDLTSEEQYSENNLTHTGWVNISMSYTPCDAITDPDLLDCTPRRSGSLNIYVNGILFHTFSGFSEFMFKALDTVKEKQIGVSYTLSWGGGATGLPIAVGTGNMVGFDFLTNLVAQNYSGSFQGGGQTLRIYDRPLSVLEARQNHNVLASRYGLTLVQGGRVTPKIDW